MQHYLIHTISSKHMRPMVQSLFGEMTILGFLSVVTFCISQAGLLRKISVDIFNDSEEGKEYLTELFERVHYLLFAIMVLFIVKVLILLHLANGTVRKWKTANKEAQNPDDVKRIADKYLHKVERKWKCTFTQTESYQFFRFLSLRREFIACRQPFAPFDIPPPDKQLPVHFSYAEYLSICLGRFLAEVIYMPPLTWIALWLLCALFFAAFVLVKGNLEFLAIIISFFGLLNLLAVIEMQKKCNAIMDMLLNPNDFPRGHITFKTGANSILASRRLQALAAAAHCTASSDNEKSGVDNSSLLDPLMPAPPSPSKRTSCAHSLPGWTEVQVKKPHKWVTMLLGGKDVVPNRQSSLFWFGRPEINLFLLRLHLVVRSVYIAVLLAVVLPDLWTEKNHALAVIVGLFSMCVIGWEYVFVMGDLITTMCHVSCFGMLRHLPTQNEVLRKQQTKRTFRAIMMMASLVQAMRRHQGDEPTHCDMAEEEVHVSQAEANDIGSIFDMYDTDGSGEIDRDELWKVMESLGFSVDEEELDATFALVDTNHDGVISRREFIRWHVMSKDRKKSDMKELARHMFEMFDTDHRCVLRVYLWVV